MLFVDNKTNETFIVFHEVPYGELRRGDYYIQSMTPYNKDMTLYTFRVTENTVKHITYTATLYYRCLKLKDLLDIRINQEL